MDMAAAGMPEPEGVCDAENYTLTISGGREIKVELFEKVKVRISDEAEQSTGKRKIKLQLL